MARQAPGVGWPMAGVGKGLVDFWNRKDERNQHIRDHHIGQMAIDAVWGPIYDARHAIDAVRKDRKPQVVPPKVVTAPTVRAANVAPSKSQGIHAGKDPLGLGSGRGMTIPELRKTFPALEGLSDRQVADAFHGAYYGRMPKADFYARIGFQPALPRPPADPQQRQPQWAAAGKRQSFVQGLTQPLANAHNANHEPAERLQRHKQVGDWPGIAGDALRYISGADDLAAVARYLGVPFAAAGNALGDGMWTAGLRPKRVRVSIKTPNGKGTDFYFADDLSKTPHSYTRPTRHDRILVNQADPNPAAAQRSLREAGNTVIDILTALPAPGLTGGGRLSRLAVLRDARPALNALMDINRAVVQGGRLFYRTANRKILGSFDRLRNA